MFKKTSHTLSLLFRITRTACANISFPLEQKSASVLQFCRRYIGCGIGRWCQVAAKYAKRVVGVERITAQWSLSPLRAKNKFFRFL